MEGGGVRDEGVGVVKVFEEGGRESDGTWRRRRGEVGGSRGGNR